MHRKTAALLGALLLAAPTGAIAQHSGTQAEQDACTPDVFRLCQDAIPDEGQIVACLKEKHAQLSAACEPVMFPRAAAEAASPDNPAPPKVRHRHKKKHRSKPHE